MNPQAAVPMAIGLAAILLLLALGLGRRWRGSTSVWIVLVPAVLPPLAAGLYALQRFRAKDARALEALSTAALATLATLTVASLVIASRAASRTRPERSNTAFLALGIGLGGIAALAFAARSELGVLVAALPATAGVLSAWLGARSASSRVDAEASATAAFETLLAIFIAFGGVACASIVAAAVTLGATKDGALALVALSHAILFALPPAAAAAITWRGRVALIGLGARHRVPELVATTTVLVAGAALLRVELGWALRHQRAQAPIRIATPAPELPVRQAEPTSAAVPKQQPAEVEVDAADSDAETPVTSDAVVAFERVRVNGMLTPESVQTRVERTRRRIEKCHESSKAPGAGQLTVRLMIGENGSVSKVWEGESADSLDRGFVSCVLTTFYQVGFPNPTRGIVRVEVPIQIREP